MAPARHVIVAGAGIGGLTAALALARAGMRVTVLEQAERLEETGAGLQLSPNASRVLIALGLRERLEPVAVGPQAIRVMAIRETHWAAPRVPRIRCSWVNGHCPMNSQPPSTKPLTPFA